MKFFLISGIVFFGFISFFSVLLYVFKKINTGYYFVVSIMALSFFGYYYYLYSKPAYIPLVYEKEVVCGVFLDYGASKERYLGRGKPNISLIFDLKKYGYINYGHINSFGTDLRTHIKYDFLVKNKNYCLSIKKPLDRKNWDDDFIIVEVK